MNKQNGPNLSIVGSCKECTFLHTNKEWTRDSIGVYQREEHVCRCPGIMLGGQGKYIGSTFTTPSWCPLWQTAVAEQFPELLKNGS